MEVSCRIVLSKRSTSLWKSKKVTEWRLNGGRLIFLFFIWAVCGVLVAAKNSEAISVQKSTARLKEAVAPDLKVSADFASIASRNDDDSEDVFELGRKGLVEEEKKAVSRPRKEKSFTTSTRARTSTDHRTGGVSSEDVVENSVVVDSTAKQSDRQDEEPDGKRVHRRGNRNEESKVVDEPETEESNRRSASRSHREHKSHQKDINSDVEQESTKASSSGSSELTHRADSNVRSLNPTSELYTKQISDDRASSDLVEKLVTDTQSDESKGPVQEEVAAAAMEDKELIPEYSLGEPIKDWDGQRRQWLEDHPDVKPYTSDGRMRIFMLTGTQPWPCQNKEADHFLLRCFKNKVDYCRIHEIEIFYNMALLDPDMPTFWAKLPVVRATMLAHPEVEWIWWLDADAIITDMEFEIPLEKYDDYNMVVHGWEGVVFEKRSWLGLNAGSFLIRNCQWSMDLMERWASMGPKGPMGAAFKDILSDFLPDRPRNPTDDQAAFVYLMIKEKEKWAGKLKMELEYFLSGYWLELMDGFEAMEEKYREMEKREGAGIAREEKMVVRRGRAREKSSMEGVAVQERRAFVTHFTGCQPCSGHHNGIYTAEQCQTGLVRALNYGDDQVLRTLGFRHRALHLPDVHPDRV